MTRLKPIESFILTIRGRKVMIDSDLAAVYGVETRAQRGANSAAAASQAGIGWFSIVRRLSRLLQHPRP